MNYHAITHPDINNGIGLRVTLWVSGCSHHCDGCHNPQTWDYESGMEFDDEARKRLFSEISKPYIFGLTLSGGDPLYYKNLQDIKELLYEFKMRFPQKTVWLYTGYSLEEIFDMERTNLDARLRREIFMMCDVVVDGEYVKELRDLSYPWAGSINQRVIDVKKTFDDGVVVPYTANDENCPSGCVWKQVNE